MQIGAIILSGGKSSRFGTDKGLYQFNEKPLIQHTIDAVKLFTEDIIIITGNNAYEKFNYKLFSDIYPLSGPMGGIHSGLVHSKNEINIVLSSDTPFINKDIIQLLIKSYNSEDVLIAKTSNGKFQTLVGIYHKRITKTLEKELTNKHFKMIHLIKQLNYKLVEIQEGSDFERCFINFNHLSDIEKYGN